ncbi:hypothetical protein EYF80_026849 [Liparis tanakae]|uniref:Uncharacterized protein n=1 Tax=Liparis tanakae TaxID=230148 RepID=A0A4Z2HAH2_9TELE|nr:hypothetical protein EYF80_026849 [Liparis tanakae]
MAHWENVGVVDLYPALCGISNFRDTAARDDKVMHIQTFAPPPLEEGRLLCVVNKTFSWMMRFEVLGDRSEFAKSRRIVAVDALSSMANGVGTGLALRYGRRTGGRADGRTGSQTADTQRLCDIERYAAACGEPASS